MDRLNELRFVIDDVTYVIEIANAAPALEVAVSLAPMLATLNISLENKLELKEFPIGIMIAYLANPNFRSVREYLVQHINVQRPGQKPYRMSDQYEAHMNAYPSHYIQLIARSFKFQFLRFFRVGGAAGDLVPEKLRTMFERFQTGDQTTATPA
jgi:hypothetical protein